MAVVVMVVAVAIVPVDAEIGLVSVVLVELGGEEVIGLVVVVGLVGKVGLLVLGEVMAHGRVLLLSKGLRSETQRESKVAMTYHLNLCLHMCSKPVFPNRMHSES